jgi:hypothetical protein
VRAAPDRPQDFELVVLDHGMYRRLSHGFRRSYCDLWHALIIGDVAAGEDAAVALGMPREDFGHIALILTFQPAGGRVGQKLSAEDLEKLRSKYKHFTPRDVNEALQRLPRDLLFLNRSTSLVRSLNLELGGTSRERFFITAEAAVLGIQLTRDLRAAGHYVPALPVLGGAGAEVEASIVESLDDSPSNVKGGLFLQLFKALTPQKQGAPLTYAYAEAAGFIKVSPTESELLRAAWAKGAGSTIPRAWSVVQREWGLLSLRLRISAMSTAAAAASAVRDAAGAVLTALEHLGMLSKPPPETREAAEARDALDAKRRKRRGHELKDPG